MTDAISIEQRLQAIMATNLPLQQQLDAILIQGNELLPKDLLQHVLSTIEQLIVSGAAEHALKEGAHIPDFTLPDARGHAVSLSHLLHSGPVVIVFYRGAWCPYCNLQLHAYQQILPHILTLGASLVAISPQMPDQSLTLMEKQALTFAVLSDVGNQVARQFGLVFTIDEAVRTAYQQIGANLPAYNGNTSWELPMPGTFLVDQSGIVRLAYVNPDYTRRLDPSLILKQLTDLTCEAPSAQEMTHLSEK
ncbi:peroxiredoxin-like family protein [Ktedonospora formicarum]|uniref:thioredoxin-dependent peroxiredoxin n=1 Tax=Ktedonospora formicarum TaxID=2778364 RepID=A0A8J3IFC2_9CHLR|nr:peroxiredoxin-like family protein [Ktedonospora formicarum]GHO51318.1 alkyl hydroperoxide reductase [Ktedonospora formicarum]